VRWVLLVRIARYSLGERSILWQAEQEFIVTEILITVIVLRGGAVGMKFRDSPTEIGTQNHR